MTAEEIVQKVEIMQGHGYKIDPTSLKNWVEEYGKEKRMDGYKAGSDSIHNILMPELETQRRLNAAQKAKIQELEKKLLKIKQAVS